MKNNIRLKKFPLRISLMCLLVLWPSMNSTLFVQEFLEEPIDQMRLMGTDVTLPCKVKNRVGNVQWTKDGFALGTSRELENFERYSMKGNEHENDYSLRIEQVSLEDDGVYQCQIGSGIIQKATGIRSRDAYLSVLIPPTAPKILQGNHVETTVGDPLILECVARGGKPAAVITWRDYRGNILESHSEEELLPDKKRFSTKSTVRIIPRKEHHRKMISCQAANAASSILPVARILLYVRYPPEVNLQGMLRKIKEGDTVKLKCIAEANPDDVTYKWYQNGEIISNNVDTELVLPNIPRNLNGVAVSCEATNAIGKTRATHVLNVQYAPRILTPPRSTQYADKGTDAILKCDVDANPKPNIIWTWGRSNKIVGTGSDLRIEKVNENNEGQYLCRIISDDFDEISSEVLLLLKGPPKITAQSVQFGNLGNSFHVKCPIVSIPEPDHVIWFHGLELIAKGDEKYQMLQNVIENGIEATLVIHNAKEEDFGYYNCSAYNRYGEASFQIILKEEDSNSLLLIITIISASIFIVLILIIAVFVYHKRMRSRKVVQDPVNNATKSSNVQPSELEILTNDTEMKEFRPSIYKSAKPVKKNEKSIDANSDATLPLCCNRKPFCDHSLTEFSQKNEYCKDTGYFSFSDYNKNYAPPSIGQNRASVYLNVIDPRFSAAYGNPFLRNHNSTLPSLSVKGYSTIVPSSQTRSLRKNNSPLATHV